MIVYATELRLLVGWRIEDISCNSTFMKFCYCSLGEGLPMGIPYCSFSSFLFPTAVSLCACRHSNEEYCFILLLIGLPKVKFPSGLWRKSYDRHWHLRNDRNDRGYRL